MLLIAVLGAALPGAVGSASAAGPATGPVEGSSETLAQAPVDGRTELGSRTGPTERRRSGHVDVLFVGAHPDDESGGLSTYGQWAEYHDVSTGVITITRGEGGGNAVGPEEGPPLGLLREAEERRAVARADITDVHYLDEVDFYYTVSQPLTRETWGHRETLAKVVRIVRQTRPALVVTMNPAPSPGNHGNHQEAARLAIEAFYAAGDPDAFPEQIRDEGLAPWQPARLFTGGADGEAPTGPDCASGFDPADPTDEVYGVWSGRPSQRYDGESWAQVEREAQREYASQGWAGFPDVPDDPAELGCDWFTQVDATVPYTPGNTAPDAMLEGAVTPSEGGLPMGTRFWLVSESFGIRPGVPFEVTAYARPAKPGGLRGATVTLDVPAGWQVEGTGELEGRETLTTRFTVTPALDAQPGTRTRLTGTLTHRDRSGASTELVEVQPTVEVRPELLPAVAEYEEWVVSTGVPHLSGEIPAVLSLGSGGSRTVRADVTNHGDAPASGTVRLDLPEGFSADEDEQRYGPIEPGESSSVTFTVTNPDTSLPTSNEGGDYPYTLTVTTDDDSVADTTEAALELVPVTTIPQADTPPTVDGVEEPGEYDGEMLDLSRRWEGEECESAADCSATAKVAWADDALYVVVHVTDDIAGTAVEPTDCKRHWRTDSVEIALDPRGTSENTSTTFKAAILPHTTDNAPCYERDADNRQGPGEETAPGMEIAATSHEDGSAGYTVETRIALADLPAAVDPERLGLNLFVYDSDTQDLTGQTRIGWSTWQGVQGDPYRWGLAMLPGYTPPPDRPVEPLPPEIPGEAAQSVASPQSILQAVRTGIPVAGGPQAPITGRAWTSGPARVKGDTVQGVLTATGPGSTTLTVWDPEHGVLGSTTVKNDRAGRWRYAVDVDPEQVTRETVVTSGFVAPDGATHADVAQMVGVR